MMQLTPLFRKLFLLIIFVGIFALVVFYIEPPKSWNTASVFQILAFFLPLIIITTLLIDFIVKYPPHSFIVSLGLMMALAFYAVNQLTILSGLLVILITLLLYRVFPKMKLPRFRLTSGSKIPKLHIQKQEPPRRHRLRRIR